MSTFRIERDSFGRIDIPSQALYAAQTQRAINNFSISDLTMPQEFIIALAQIKQSAAKVNAYLGLLDKNIANAIENACKEIVAGKYMDHFPVDVFQTGSGTSTNMNANEVIATLASRSSGQLVHPNDHVNMGQSSNDVIPTAIHLSAATLLSVELVPALTHLQAVINEKSNSVDGYVKTGRTHLMDAMPVRMSQELDGWGAQIEQSIQSLESHRSRLHKLAQGGTAVGTGINTARQFAGLFSSELSRITGLELLPCDNFFAALGSQDTAVALSGLLKAVAVSLMKIANDLRWMNSGPLAGLGEIELQALQPGSSIMPGKVNPVIPEAVAMASAQVIGNDATITVAGQSGNFELNVMLPVIAFNLIQSLQLLTNSARSIADNAIATFVVKESNLESALARNPILVTALTPIIGYQKAAEIAKLAYSTGRPILDVAAEETQIDRKELRRLLNPAALTKGGLKV